MKSRLDRSRMQLGFLGLALAIGAGTALAVAPIDNLARYFAGIYRGVTPGNELMLQITPVTINISNPYDYFLTVSGKFENVNVREQGLLRIEPQGDSIHLGYIPHFNPGISAVTAGVAHFTNDELSSACGMYLKIIGDGFGGDTRPSECARAIRGSAGRSWRIEIEPNRITLKDAKTGETLRFEKSTGEARKEK